ncbi:hypothetical protein S40288_07895 [Stachybotrys chartarum IBT 40288]|nr:hypothetical protein S40288_07895 [Stachybotrys chartarum IBT 40288]
MNAARSAKVAAAAIATASSSYTSSVIKVADQPRPQDADAKPHHVVRNGTTTHFKNPFPSWAGEPTLDRMLVNVLWPLVKGDLKYPDVKKHNLKVVKPQWLPSRKASPNLRATWLGHACYYVEYPSGLRVLFDPVFEDRCSPLTFLGPKRYTPRPCDIKDIPYVDAVVISHSHYDHLSHSSVLEVQKYHPGAQFFVGLGLEKWFRQTGLNNVTELDWWEDADLTVKLGGAEGENGETISARFSCLPCQHTSSRTRLDTDTTLWASWAVRSGDKSVWFGGDTGYRAVPKLAVGVDDYGPEFESLPRNPQFKQIGDLRGPFDLGLIPIGAYSPRFAFSSMHANPYDSVEIFKDTRCNRAMGIHWGTWCLTMEDVLEPPKMLREALKRQGIPETGVFDICDIGSSREF